MTTTRTRQLNKIKKEDLIKAYIELESEIDNQKTRISDQRKVISDKESIINTKSNAIHDCKKSNDLLRSKIDRVRSAIYMASVFYPAPQQIESPENPGLFIDIEPQTNESKMLNQFLTIVGAG